MRDIFSVMAKSPVIDTAKTIADMIDTGTDLTWRYLLPNRKDLSASATLVLNRVNQEGPMRLTALAAAEDTSQPAMTQLVQRMERQGLLERVSDPEDGRAALVAISAAGRTNAAAAHVHPESRLSTMRLDRRLEVTGSHSVS
jgi:DNA-binding MarR family transcriptional regulator